MKRIAPVVAIGLFALSAVGACSGGPDSTSSSSTSSSGSSSGGSSGGSSSGGSSSGGSSSGATSSGGTNTCVTVDPATYDRSCTQDEDCNVFPTGNLCTGECGCGGTPLNKNESARYQEATKSIKLEACPCASPGTPRCVQSSCILCAFVNPAPGCPDGG